MSFKRLATASVLTKYNQLQQDARDQQPWRCAACNTAVRRGHNDPCKCFREVRPNNGDRAERGEV
jgi:hypothetical protein